MSYLTQLIAKRMIALANFFGRQRTARRRDVRLQLEPLEVRCVPTVTFTVTNTNASGGSVMGTPRNRLITGSLAWNLTQLRTYTPTNGEIGFRLAVLAT